MKKGETKSKTKKEKVQGIGKI